MLTKLEHMQIPVRNLGRAIDWYTSHLGFRMDGKYDHGIAFLSLSDGPMLMLWETKDTDTAANFKVNGTDFPVLLYRTERIHELHESLLGLGARIQLYKDEGFGWVLKFYDPEGNLWGAIQHHDNREEQR